MRKYFTKDKWSYLGYTLTHPSDGFYWIRHRDRGSVPIAIICVILFSFAFSLNRLLSGFVVNDIDPRSVDSLYELLGILAVFLLVCVSNWSVTCLMSGEGRMKDIVIAVGYATVPMSVGFVLATIASQFIADEEQAFYTIIITIGVAYGVLMILIGIMQVHNYTLGKTLITLFITVLAMLVIVFLILLLSNMLGMVVNFFKSVYTEIVFRT